MIEPVKHSAQLTEMFGRPLHQPIAHDAMAETTPIIFIEPLARGFRLDVLARAISAIRERSRRPIFIVTREDFVCGELARWIGPSWTDVHFVASSLDLEGASTGVLGDGAVQALLDSAADMLPRKLPERSNTRADLVFLGADDYLDALAARLDDKDEHFTDTRRFVFLYNSDDFVAGELKEGESPHLGQNAIAAIEAMDATLLAFNEGLRGERIGKRAVKVLTDPWHGYFARHQRKLARDAFGVRKDDLLVTADVDVLLDARDRSWAAFAWQLAEFPGVRFALQGNVWALRNSPLRQLIDRLGERLVYAGMERDVEQSSRLSAATDLLLGRPVASHDAMRPMNDIAQPPTSIARRVRATALGAAYDRDLMRWFQDSMAGLLSISDAGLAIVRSELDRIACERSIRTFGLQLRAALRRGSWE